MATLLQACLLLGLTLPHLLVSAPTPADSTSIPPSTEAGNADHQEGSSEESPEVKNNVFGSDPQRPSTAASPQFDYLDEKGNPTKPPPQNSNPINRNNGRQNKANSLREQNLLRFAAVNQQIDSSRKLASTGRLSMGGTGMYPYMGTNVPSGNVNSMGGTGFYPYMGTNGASGFENLPSNSNPFLTNTNQQSFPQNPYENNVYPYSSQNGFQNPYQNYPNSQNQLYPYGQSGYPNQNVNPFLYYQNMCPWSRSNNSSADGTQKAGNCQPPTTTTTTTTTTKKPDTNANAGGFQFMNGGMQYPYGNGNPYFYQNGVSGQYPYPNFGKK